eukprot:scaffold43942_cov40-Phaeocystis_antarctica.AAC.1
MAYILWSSTSAAAPPLPPSGCAPGQGEGRRGRARVKVSRLRLAAHPLELAGRLLQRLARCLGRRPLRQRLLRGRRPLLRIAPPSSSSCARAIARARARTALAALGISGAAVGPWRGAWRCGGA